MAPPTSPAASRPSAGRTTTQSSVSAALATAEDTTYLTQKEAATLMRVSVAYLRNSDCPKVLLPSGRGRRPLVRYLRKDLDTWMQRWRVARSVS